MDAFDADVLLCAVRPEHPMGRRVRSLFEGQERADVPRWIGSVLLVPELLAKPMRVDADDELRDLAALLGRLDLRPVDEAMAELATSLAAEHRLRAVDAVHLATAVSTGVDRFITNNRGDFPKSIPEVDITHPDNLPEG